MHNDLKTISVSYCLVINRIFKEEHAQIYINTRQKTMLPWRESHEIYTLLLGMWYLNMPRHQYIREGRREDFYSQVAHQFLKVPKVQIFLSTNFFAQNYVVGQVCQKHCVLDLHSQVLLALTNTPFILYIHLLTIYPPYQGRDNLSQLETNFHARE